MNICRFRIGSDHVRVGLVVDGSTICDLTPAGIKELQALLEEEDPAARLSQLSRADLPRLPLAEVQLCAPVERQEI